MSNDLSGIRQFRTKGWIVFPPEPQTLAWADAARQSALQALRDPEFAHFYKCERTWFVGLDALSNDARGSVAGSLPLSGSAIDFISNYCGGWPALHRAQVSGVFPGYPKPRAEEADSGFRYRVKRDAAHVDGVIGVGSSKRRFVQEPHAFILGFPLTKADAEAAPLVVWEGSHLILQKAFRSAFETAAGTKPEATDVTEVYQAARRGVFETCRRTIVHGPPGSAFLVHRLTLHGVAPWAETARAAPEGRLIAYFRPPMVGGARAWAVTI